MADRGAQGHGLEVLRGPHVRAAALPAPGGGAPLARAPGLPHMRRPRAYDWQLTAALRPHPGTGAGRALQKQWPSFTLYKGTRGRATCWCAAGGSGAAAGAPSSRACAGTLRAAAAVACSLSSTSCATPAARSHLPPLRSADRGRAPRRLGCRQTQAAEPVLLSVNSPPVQEQAPT